MWISTAMRSICKIMRNTSRFGTSLWKSMRRGGPGWTQSHIVRISGPIRGKAIVCSGISRFLIGLRVSPSRRRIRIFLRSLRPGDLTIVRVGRDRSGIMSQISRGMESMRLRWGRLDSREHPNLMTMCLNPFSIRSRWLTQRGGSIMIKGSLMKRIAPQIIGPQLLFASIDLKETWARWWTRKVLVLFLQLCTKFQRFKGK